MNDVEIAAFNKGKNHGRTEVLLDLLENSDKPSAILALYRIASNEAKKEQQAKQANPKSRMAERMAIRYEAYAEGLRHALLIMENQGNALETYNNIIKPSIRVPLLQQDIDHPESIISK